MRAYITQIRMNLRLTTRDRAVVFFNFVFPMIFFFMFGQLMHAEQGGAASVVNRVLTIGVLGTGLFGAGMRAVMEREQGILRRFKVAPINAGPILASGMVTGLVLFLPLTLLVLVLARTMYAMPPLEHPISFVLFIGLG